ncbi:MAG: oligosaccharide flippase family protein [Thermodesulfobacteriota bacterium]|nr:oligosaccharide flippase family protein [Thermodesulfobacteriota bacterium]
MNMNRSEVIHKGLKSGKYVIILRSLSQAATLIVTVLLVRALSETQFGIYNLLYSVIPLLSVIASFGLTNTLQRYIPEYYSKGEYQVANNLYRIASLIRLLSNIVILGLFLFFWNIIAPLFKLGEYRNYFILFTLVVFLYMQRELLETCLTSYFLHKYTQALTLIFAVIKALGYAFVILMEMDLWTVISIDLSAHIFIFITLQIIYGKKVPHKTDKSATILKEEKKRLLRYSMYYNLNDAGVGLLGGRFDNFIIVMYMTPAAVGAYSFCLRISEMIERILPLNYFIGILRPAFFSLGMDLDRQHVNKFYQALVKTTYLFHAPILVFLFMFGTEMINVLFEGKFMTFWWILFLIFLFKTINAFTVPVSLVAQLNERADIILYSKIFAAYNIFADIILIKHFGVLGAVLATGTAHFGKNIFIWYFVRKDATFKGMGTFFMTLTGYWIVFSGGLFILKSVCSGQILLLCAGTFVIIVGVILQCKLKILIPRELGLLAKHIENPFFNKISGWLFKDW